MSFSTTDRKQLTMSDEFGKPNPGENTVSDMGYISSARLLNKQGRLMIEHNGEKYILRITRSGKLILTK